MAIDLNKKKKTILKPITIPDGEITKIIGYQIPAWTNFQFGKYYAGDVKQFKNLTLSVNQDYEFMLENKYLNITDLQTKSVEILKLLKFNGTMFSMNNGKLISIGEDDIDNFFIKNFNGLEPVAFTNNRVKSVSNQTVSYTMKSNVINFSNREFNDEGEEIFNEEDYIAKQTFNAEYKTLDEISNDAKQYNLWNDYLIYAYGEENKFNMNKVFSTIFWTDSFIEQNRKVIFSVTPNGGSGRTTIINKLREFTFIQQSSAVWKNAENSKFQGNKELKTAHHNLIDDPNTNGEQFVIKGNWLKDLTLEYFKFKSIGKDETIVSNILQNLVFLNNARFELSEAEKADAELDRIDWIQVDNHKKFNDWERKEEFIKEFDYEWLLLYLFHFFTNNKEQIRNSFKKFDEKKYVQQDVVLEENFLDEIEKYGILTFAQIKNVLKNIDYKCKSWNNRQFVSFLSKVEFPNNYEVKIYDSKNNESKSYIKKITPLNNIPIKTEEKKKDKPKNAEPNGDFTLALKKVGAIKDIKKDKYWKYIINDGVLILDIEPIEKDKGLVDATKEYLINGLKPTVYSETNGGLHLWYKYDVNMDYVNNVIENVGIKVEIKTKEIFVKDNYRINGELELVEEKCSYMLKRKTVGVGSDFDFSTGTQQEIYSVIKDWNCRHNRTFFEVIQDYRANAVDRNNTLFNLRGWLLNLKINEKMVNNWIIAINRGATAPLPDNEIKAINREK